MTTLIFILSAIAAVIFIWIIADMVFIEIDCKRLDKEITRMQEARLRDVELWKSI